MIRLLARRVVQAAATLLLVGFLVMLLARLAPGDALPGDMSDGTMERMTPEQRAELRSLYHADRTLPAQYGLWLLDIARGDLGLSFHDRRPVIEKIGECLGVSLTLNLAALLTMVAVALVLGTAAAFRPRSTLDRVAALGTYALYAVPVFWAGLLLQMLFSVRLGWAPLYGVTSPSAENLSLAARVGDRAAHMVLPVLCLSYSGLAYLSRFVRATLLEGALVEATRAARARGLSPLGVILRHGFRQASVPMLTLAGFLLPRLVGGSVIVETIFAIPGLGRLFVEAMFERDMPVLMGLTLLSGVATLAGVVAADLAYSVADPRVRRD